MAEFGHGQLFFLDGELYAVVYHGLETSRVKMLANVELKFCILGLEDMDSKTKADKAIITWGGSVQLDGLPARSLFLYDNALHAVTTRYATGVRVKRLTDTDMRYREQEPYMMEGITTVTEVNMRI